MSEIHMVVTFINLVLVANILVDIVDRRSFADFSPPTIRQHEMLYAKFRGIHLPERLLPLLGIYFSLAESGCSDFVCHTFRSSDDLRKGEEWSVLSCERSTNTASFYFREGEGLTYKPFLQLSYGFLSDLAQCLLKEFAFDENRRESQTEPCNEIKIQSGDLIYTSPETFKPGIQLTHVD